MRNRLGLSLGGYVALTGALIVCIIGVALYLRFSKTNQEFVQNGPMLRA